MAQIFSPHAYFKELLEMNTAFNERWLIIRRYLNSVWKHNHVFVGMLICMIIVGLLEPLLPWILGPLLDAGNTEKTYPISPALLPYVAVLIIILRSALSYGRTYCGFWLEATLQKDFRQQMASHLLRLPAQHLQHDSLGLITSRFMSYLPSLTHLTMPLCMAFLQETLKIVGYLSLMIYIQWELAFVILIITPLIALSIRYFNKRMKKNAHKAQQAVAEGQNHLNESVQLWQLIKNRGGQSAQNWLNRDFAKMRNTALKINIILSAGQPITHLLLSIPFAIIIFYTLDALSNNTMSPGEVATFITTMLLIPVPIRNIVRATNSIEQMFVAAREVYGFLDLELEEDKGQKILQETHHDIHFDNIHFQYPKTEHPVLTNLSLHIPKGQTIALVGQSGCGKTTLANLLLRFYPLNAGTIKINNEDIKNFSLASFRQHITLLTQKPLLFNDTIAMNIAYPEVADEARLAIALKKAKADEFVSRLPKGVQTLIGDEGNSLSLGQRQRLIIARAFYRETPLVILDEISSALDSETEALIKPALKELLMGKTAIIISHQFKTIEFANKIVVLDKGQIIAEGDMDSLRKNCPLFETLYKKQKLD